jgi:hypothetical protein
VIRPTLLFLCCLLTSCKPPWGWGPPPWDVYAKEELNVDFYKSVWTDLNGDGIDEIILYATDSSWCGSGGCTLFILENEGSSFRVVSRTTISNLPVKLLDSSNNGWRDIAITVRGGGVMEPYEVLLSFDGESYPSNPTIPPALRLEEVSGVILIEE